MGKKCINRQQAKPEKCKVENLIHLIKDSKNVIVGFTKDSPVLMVAAGNVLHRILEGLHDQHLIPVRISKDSEIPAAVKHLTSINYWEKGFRKKLEKALDKQFDLPIEPVQSVSPIQSISSEVDDFVIVESEWSDAERQDISSGEAIQVVDYDKHGQLQFHGDELASILMAEDLKDDTVVVLSIAGKLREGKSYLLNCIIKFLSSNCSRTWMKDKGQILEGFGWGGGSEQITTGMWIWNKVFLVQGPNGKKVRVVLIDNQGTKSRTSSVNNDAALFSLSTLLSSIQIFNISSDINAENISFLELGFDFAAHLKEDHNICQTLLLLIRDWKYPMEKAYGEEGGLQHLKTCMGQMSNGSHRRIFERVEESKCFLLPLPGNNIVMGKSKGYIKDMDEEFQKYLDMLLQRLLSDILKASNQKVTCGELCNFFKKYVDISKSTNLFYRPAEIHAVNHCFNVLRDILKEVDKQLRELKNKSHINIKDTREDIKRDKLNKFDNDCSLFMCDDYNNIRSELESNIIMRIQDFEVDRTERQIFADKDNQRLLNEAVISFTAVLDDVCLIPVDPDDFKKKSDEEMVRALQIFDLRLNRFGPRSHYFQDELKTRLGKLYKVYCKKNEDKREEADLRSTLERLKLEEESNKQEKKVAETELKLKEISARRKACLKYEEIMKKFYEKYQQKEMEIINHKNAREAALATYQLEMGVDDEGISKENLKCLEEDIDRIKKPIFSRNNRLEENAREKNNNIYNKALTLYRDTLLKSDTWFDFGIFYEDKKKNATDEYKRMAKKGFPSYEANLEDLEKAIDKLNKDIDEKKEKVWWRSLRVFHYIIQRQLASIVIPENLFKKTEE